MSDINIISFDGGGVRGLLQAACTQYLEKHISAPLFSKFHIKAGTSTGAISAAALSRPIGWNKPLCDAKEVYGHFTGQSLKDIFKFRSKMSGSMPSLFVVPFNNIDKRKVLEKTLNQPYAQKENKDLYLSDIQDNLIITAAEPITYTPFIMNSEEARKGDIYDYKVSAAVNASTAAPGDFSLPSVRNKKGESFVLTDGSLAAKNPAGIAFNRAVREYGFNNQFNIVSLGTGYKDMGLSPEYLKKLTKAKWANRIATTFMSTQSNLVLNELDAFPNVKIYRFDINLDSLPKKRSPSWIFTDSSKKNITNLKYAANAMIKQNKEQLDELCKFLTETPDTYTFG